MLRHPVTRTNFRSEYDRVLPLASLAGPPVSVAGTVKTRRVEHRDGAGHLDPAYEADLRARAHERAQSTRERAFVSTTSSIDASGEEFGEQFVWSVTSGVDGKESALDDETTEERGGPFVETSGHVEFAYGPDESNPTGATREPFPTS